jgi:hypothetical protein
MRSPPLRGLFRFSAVLSLASTLSSAPGAAAELLPEVAVHLRLARYMPSDPGLEWDGWVGAGFGLLRAGSTTAYLRADVESVASNEGISVLVDQVNYQIEGGVHRDLWGGDASLFVHHVSRHLADQAKSEKVDWNLIGIRYARRLTRTSGPALWLGVGQAVAVSTSVVDYRAETTLLVDVEPIGRQGARAYLLGALRYVLTDPDAPAARGGFADARVEAGVRLPRADRALEAFAAYEHRNDVRVTGSAAGDRALLGIRLRSVGDPAGGLDGAAARGTWRVK